MRLTVTAARKLFGKRAVPSVPRAANAAEAEMARQLAEAGIDFEPQYRFAVHRRWKLDFAIWPADDSKRWIGLDIDGGAHRIRDKFARDIERHNALAMTGAWLHLRASKAMVWSGEALELIRMALS